MNRLRNSPIFWRAIFACWWSNNKAELQALKRGLIRSNTRNDYKGDADDEWVEEHGEIQRIAKAIEDRRQELNKTSGFEKL
ncbi:MAG: hypothetical protein ACRD9S_03420 [Pyrinomonadaceae bacterium]